MIFSVGYFFSFFSYIFIFFSFLPKCSREWLLLVHMYLYTDFLYIFVLFLFACFVSSYGNQLRWFNLMGHTYFSSNSTFNSIKRTISNLSQVSDASIFAEASHFLNKILFENRQHEPKFWNKFCFWAFHVAAYQTRSYDFSSYIRTFTIFFYPTRTIGGRGLKK